MKNIYNLLTLFVLVFLAASCTQQPVADPPILSNKWATVYDTDAEGISQVWFKEFPSSRFSGSTWDDWQIKNARYRWHKQSFKVGKLDSTASYLLTCNTIASTSLIWLNGDFLDQVDFTDSYAIKICNYLHENTYNEIIIRNEYKEDSFGILDLKIIKASPDTTISNKKYDYYSMPLYHEPASYVDNLILYEAYIRNMSPSGTFTGLENTISRLKQLGVNMVWLMPIHPIGREDKMGTLGSPYAVRNYFTTNSRYGSLSQFSSMRSMLHRNKIKLIIDAVVNQTASDHPWVSDYPTYYQQDDDGKLLAPPGSDRKDVLALNYDNENLRTRIISYFDFWFEQGVDGFRCNGSDDIPRDFWQDVRDHFKENNIDPFLLAGSDDPEHVLFGMDAVVGWDLYYTFTDIANGEANASSIGKTLANEIKKYPRKTKVLHFAENHETARATKALGTMDHHLALFTIFTAPGIPMIYCGEELNDPTYMSLYDKTDINWYKIHWPTYNLISKLSRFRTSSPILTKGDLHQIADTKSVGGFSRRYRNETWFILMNYSENEQMYQCDVKTTVFSDGTSGVVRNGRVRLKPKGYCIVK